MPAKNYTGSIEIGKCADVIIADIEKLKDGYKLKIENVFVKGYQIS
jgi:imidazolonepropionase-like amidohydrolase